jgi:hypothetical protein
MTAVKPSLPALRGADGSLIAEFARLRGDLYTDDGEPIPGDSPLNLDRMIAACPFRSYRLRQVPGTIGSVWVVPTDDPIPPLFILQDMAQVVVARMGILLLATNKTARDRAREFIERMFSLAGVDAVAEDAERQHRWEAL